MLACTKDKFSSVTKIYQEVEEEDTHDYAEKNPNKIRNLRVRNSVHFRVVVGESKDGDVRTTNGI